MVLISKIKNSINKKFFLITSTILILCSIFIYIFIVFAMPYAYRIYINKNIEKICETLPKKSQEIYINDFKNLMDDSLFSNLFYAYILFDEEDKYVTIYDSEYLTYTYFTDKQNDSLNFTKEDFLLSYNHARDKLNSEELLKYLASDKKLDIPEKLLNSKFKSINLRLKNNKKYTLFLFFGLQPISDASKAILMLFPICFMIILFISFISAFIYSKIITKPIIKISKDAEKMSSLELDTRCSVKSNDEIGILASSLNNLSENLSLSLNELKDKNIMLKKEIEKEREIDKMRRDFFNAVSHELKTPITIIKGQLEGMIYNVGVYKNRDKYLNRSLEVTESMEKLIKEILTISRMESNNFKLDLNEENLSFILKESLNEYYDLAEYKNIKINLNLEENLYVKIDKNLFKKALGNIINNALMYSPKSSIIYIHLTKTPLSLEIINTNTSIQEKNIDKLFTPFYRIDKSRNRNTGGSGLGLYIVKNILEFHNFKYEIKNIDIGVSFKISF